jgi:hypothetical protein
MILIHNISRNHKFCQIISGINVYQRIPQLVAALYNALKLNDLVMTSITAAMSFFKDNLAGEASPSLQSPRPTACGVFRYPLLGDPGVTSAARFMLY